MKMQTTAIAALFGGLLLAGCGGESAEPEANGEPSTKASSDCLKVPAKMGKAIASGAVDGSGVKYESAAAVKSEDHGEMYYIAMTFSADGIEGERGVWASNSLKPGGGLILSVDGLANEFTEWPNGADTEAATSVADPGAKAALDCL